MRLPGILALLIVVIPFVSPVSLANARPGRPALDGCAHGETPGGSRCPNPALVTGGADARGAKSFRNCAEARAAGVAPIYRGQPGYAPHLDRDHDGIACEPYRGP